MAAGETVRERWCGGLELLLVHAAGAGAATTEAGAGQ
jgi:hypothetical protein